MALHTAKEVITHVPWSALTPRFHAIVGSATFAMVESRTCINVASDNASTASHILGGVKAALSCIMSLLTAACNNHITVVMKDSSDQFVRLCQRVLIHIRSETWSVDGLMRQ